VKQKKNRSETMTKGRPKGSTTRAPGKNTCLYIEDTTKEWLEKNRYTPTKALFYAPDWHDKMTALAEEVNQLRRTNERQEKEILKLQTENIDLLRLRNKFLDKIRKEANHGTKTESAEIRF
jgi:hypothetical protein